MFINKMLYIKALRLSCRFVTKMQRKIVNMLLKCAFYKVQVCWKVQPFVPGDMKKHTDIMQSHFTCSYVM